MESLLVILMRKKASVRRCVGVGAVGSLVLLL